MSCRTSSNKYAHSELSYGTGNKQEPRATRELTSCKKNIINLLSGPRGYTIVAPPPLHVWILASLSTLRPVPHSICVSMSMLLFSFLGLRPPSTVPVPLPCPSAWQKGAVGTRRETMCMLLLLVLLLLLSLVTSYICNKLCAWVGRGRAAL